MSHLCALQYNIGKKFLGSRGVVLTFFWVKRNIFLQFSDKISKLGISPQDKDVRFTAIQILKAEVLSFQNMYGMILSNFFSIYFN